MRLRMRYESAKMGMDDEHCALNIMSKLVKHKPKAKKKKKKREKVFRALKIHHTPHIAMSII